VRRTRDTLIRGAVELRQPGGLWLVHAVRTQEALIEGRVADAERAVQEMLEQPSFKANVEQAATAALFLIRREQGGHVDLALALEGLAAQYPGMSAWRAALAMLWADAGDAERCRAALGDVTADGLAGVCRDSTWLFSMSCLAEACGAFGSVAQAELLYGHLVPYAHANTMAGPLYYLAPVAYYLGILQRVRGQLADAAGYLDAAAERARRLGAQPALARIESARRRTADALVAGRLDRVQEIVGRARGETQRAVLRLEGDTCVLSFRGRTSTVKNVRGLQYLARLLAAPRREFHVLDLVGAEAGAPGASGNAPGDLGPLLDARARGELAHRLALLRDELADAESDADPARATRARAEMEAIGDQLAAAVRLGGRDRRTGDPAERARAAVTKAVRAAIERIGRADPELGDLLTRTVRTGTFCVYAPLEALAIEWSIRRDGETGRPATEL
jgi:hypothetical protein